MLVVDYLDKNLVVLKENLNKENFDRIRSVIWESSAQKLDETIQASIYTAKLRPSDRASARASATDLPSLWPSTSNSCAQAGTAPCPSRNSGRIAAG